MRSKSPPQRNPTKPGTAARGGYSLLELVLAVALVGGTLAPAMALLRDGMELSRTTDQRQLLTNYAVQKMEEKLPTVAAGWTTPVDLTETGDLAADGFASLRYIVTVSDLATNDGLPDELMHVQVTTYIDQDNDDALGADEPQSTFRTKIAKLLTYVAEATP